MINFSTRRPTEADTVLECDPDVRNKNETYRILSMNIDDVCTIREFLERIEQDPPRFDYKELSDPLYSNPLMYIAGDGGGLHADQLNVCVNSSADLKHVFRSVKFPELSDCIVLWYHKGQNDEEDWYLVGRHDYKCTRKVKHCYFLMSAWCDNTGFDCKGEIRFDLSGSLHELCYYGMTDKCRRLILGSIPPSTPDTQNAR